MTTRVGWGVLSLTGMLLFSGVNAGVPSSSPAPLTAKLRAFLILYLGGRYKHPDVTTWVRLAALPRTGGRDIVVYYSPTPGPFGVDCQNYCDVMILRPQGRSWQIVWDQRDLAGDDDDLRAESDAGLRRIQTETATRLYTSTGPEPSSARRHLRPSVKRFVRALQRSSNFPNQIQIPMVSADIQLHDGRTDTIVHMTGDEGCGATGLCATMIIEPRGRSYKILFDDSVATPIRRLPTVTNGHPDLSVWMHENAFANYEVELVFNGKHYVYAEKLNGYVQDLQAFRLHEEPRSRRLPDRPFGHLVIGEDVGEKLVP